MARPNARRSVCCHTIEDVGEAASIPIGSPIANTQAYVLDDRRELLPIGIAGELYIGGDGLARGYLKQPELTAERFVEVAGLGRLYRTGDFVRWRADGTLEFLGRRDEQVKLRGFRIEPGEIEAALLENTQIAEAVVVVRGEAEHRQLVAYLRPAGAMPDLHAVRECLRRVLPSYMVPARFVILEQLPLSPNGKVDRRALPPPEEPAESPPVRGLTPTEESAGGFVEPVAAARGDRVRRQLF